ncbi:MAG: hypothetical protein ACR2PL_03320 [Dehalococcoidia bacterium]
MKAVKVTEFDEHASEIVRSDDVTMVTRDGKPVGFYIPLDQAELPVELRRVLFAQLTDRIGAQLQTAGVTEEEILADFAADRAARRTRR